MKRSQLELMSNDELWTLYEGVSEVLAARLVAERDVLEKRLKLLSGQSRATQSGTSARRPYPAVLPRFRNPDNTTETWAGRGKQPRWVAQQLRSGKRFEEFRVR